MRPSPAVKFIATWLTVALWASAARATDFDTPVGSRCMSREDAALLKQAGHLGKFKCDGTSFRFLGRIESAADNYLVYDFRFLFKAAAADHGGQRLIIFDRNGRYLGQYAFYSRPLADIAVEGSSVRLTVPGETRAIDFSPGPPPSIYFDGDTQKFYK
jgi:hypothetical protein